VNEDDIWEATTVTIAPKGARWPWCPVYRGKYEPIVLDDGSVEFTAAGPLTKGRIGWRLWLSTLWRKVRP